MPSRQMDVTTWYLEQTAPDELRPGRVPDSPLEIVRAEVPSPELSRFLYTAVGGDWYWTDRLTWSYEQWQNWLERPGVETWVAYVRGTPAGYVELDPQPEGQVEITSFGLLGAFTGRGLGGHLLTVGASRAWDLVQRWPDRKATERVWLHTCSNDGPAALPNYQARGFRVFDVRSSTETRDHTPPGPWPGAR
ncbi:GNAT family N-acetyltransferase [Spirillospora sp. NPDC047279]|uniref:GNAT family N-acetyltransferase n=1 Tax=Spirillospora sp. NPDC047279 TaxID=3155478 RepID=UPI0033C14FBD